MKSLRVFLIISIFCQLGAVGCKTHQSGRAGTATKSDWASGYQAIELGQKNPSDELALESLRALLSDTNLIIAHFGEGNGLFQNSEQNRLGFPAELAAVPNKVRDLGFVDVLDPFIKSLNRAAELSARDVSPYLAKWIPAFSPSEPLTLLKTGPDGVVSAFKKKRAQNLKRKLRPAVKKSIRLAQVMESWAGVAAAYEKIPGVGQVSYDWEKYIIDKTVDGYFQLMASEEAKLRQFPEHRQSELVRVTLGWVDAQK